ncbi:MAG: MFS transporter [Bacillus sp. (in: Bacteria)]|nr:MFS transporter [Bacillus sp. (in: firmicutes)]MCM1426665.1 MFS transporter [Eubacterium sp.]
MNADFKKYIIFWLSQSVSQLGSAMTSFALILWAYTQNHSALTVSLMSFCSYVPYIIVSLFAGTFVDNHNKKRIMLAADTGAALCSVCVLLLYLTGGLQIGHIYLVNCIIGFMNAFQSPASSVAIGRIVPKNKLANVSGMNSFSANLTSVLTPVLAAFLFALDGLRLILIIDFASFLFAFFVLLIFIFIPETEKTDAKQASLFAGCKEGFAFLRENRGIFTIILTMALLNFFSRLTYENILSPMILSRSGGDSVVLGVVNAVMGVGGIIGGIIVSAGKLSKNNVKMIYVSAAVSFLLGDLLMGVGRNVIIWSIAGLAASLPIPFINAGQNVILYKKVPDEIQGRVFAVRNAIQFSTIPIGILLGGFLADYAFEPYMRTNSPVTDFLHLLVGNGAGSGMAVMFLCTGVCGAIFSCLSYRSREIQKLG